MSEAVRVKCSFTPGIGVVMAEVSGPHEGMREDRFVINLMTDWDNENPDDDIGAGADFTRDELLELRAAIDEVLSRKMV